MLRETRSPRKNCREKIERLGLLFHSVDDQPYWNESAAYRFEKPEIDKIEAATNELQAICLEAVERIISQDQFDRLNIPEWVRPTIVNAWDDDPPALYGRFDLAYNGNGDPKLLEYNADTPTSLLEAAVIQLRCPNLQVHLQL